MTTTAPTTTEKNGAKKGSRLPGWARSARTRIALSFLALLAASSLVTVLALRQILISRADDRVDRQLEQEVLEFERLADLGQDPRTGQPFGDDIRSVFEVFLSRNVPARDESFFTFFGGTLFRSSVEVPEDELLAEVTELGGGITTSSGGEFESEGETVRYLAVPITTGGPNQGAFIVTAALGPERAEIDEDVRVAAGVSLIVFLLAAGIVFATVGRVLAPVRVLTDTARNLTESDLTKRIEVEGNDELAELARTFNAMLDRLESAFAGQQRFLGDAGHELRTPITIVRGHLEVMGDDPAEQRETIALVTDELDRMGRMVDDLLLLERTGRPDFLRLETVEVGGLIEDTVTKATAIAPRSWAGGGERRGTTEVDRQRIQQALLNLAENAAKHTTEGDRIEIGGEVMGGEARLWVRDAGPGVDPGEQGTIFERFHRSERAEAGQGSGLGLSVVKAIAEAHGGRVELDSSLGAGSTFTLVLSGSPERGGRA